MLIFQRRDLSLSLSLDVCQSAPPFGGREIFPGRLAKKNNSAKVPPDNQR